MSNVRIQGNASGTGTITLQAPNTNTDRTINLPDVDGNLGLTTGVTSITIQNEGSALTTAGEVLNFVGSGVTASGTGTTKTISIAAGGGVTVQEEGSSLSTVADTLNFVGSNVTASGTGTTKTITISGGSGGGITMAESWRLTADHEQATNIVQEYVTSNWEVSDSTGYGSLGTGLTESSGVFSFPSTGIYFIHVQGEVTDNGGSWTYAEFSLQVTTNNSTYTAVNFLDSRGSRYEHFHNGMSSMIDVTDTSNVKFKFGLKMRYAGGRLHGDTDKTRTGFTVIRLGDT